VNGPRLDITRGPSESPEATITTDPGTLATVLWHGGDARAITVEGDRSAFERFAALFQKT
jgi:hypothetical protein